MTSSALVLGLLGLAASFMPQELAPLLGLPLTASLLLQIMGGMYCGAALMNWMAKSHLIGGIYSRPLSMGNWLHFSMGALALLHRQLAGLQTWPWLLLTLVYAALALAFGWIIFRHGTACRPTSE